MAVRLRERDQILLRRTFYQAVCDLVAQDPAAQHVLGGAPPFKGVAADPHFADQSGFLQGAHSMHHRPVSGQRTRPVNLIEIEARDSEPACTGEGTPFYPGGTGRNWPYFRSQDRRFPVFAECPAEDPLAAP